MIYLTSFNVTFTSTGISLSHLQPPLHVQCTCSSSTVLYVTCIHVYMCTSAPSSNKKKLLGLGLGVDKIVLVI